MNSTGPRVTCTTSRGGVTRSAVSLRRGSTGRSRSETTSGTVLSPQSCRSSVSITAPSPRAASAITMAFRPASPIALPFRPRNVKRGMPRSAPATSALSGRGTLAAPRPALRRPRRQSHCETNRAPSAGACLAARPPVSPSHSGQSCSQPSAASPGRSTVAAPGPAPRRPRRQSRCHLNLTPSAGLCLAARPPVPIRRRGQSCSHLSAASPGQGTVPEPGLAPRCPRRRSRCHTNLAPSGGACLAARPPAPLRRAR
eukprot:scaffold854_cov343-Prasinococcus_capsulatus_cf.AAC.8